MAWTDAARQAAKLARQAKASKTVNIPGVRGIHSDFAVSRGQYASALKAIRKTVSVGGPKDKTYFRTKSMATRAGANVEVAIATKRLIPGSRKLGR